jgi:hypothetical protein
MLFSDRISERRCFNLEVGRGPLSSARRDCVKSITFRLVRHHCLCPRWHHCLFPPIYYPYERPSFVRSQIRIRTAANDRHACTPRSLNSRISAKFELLVRYTVKSNTDNLSFRLQLPSSRKRIQAESRLVRRILVAVGGIQVMTNSCETPD